MLGPHYDMGHKYWDEEGFSLTLSASILHGFIGKVIKSREITQKWLYSAQILPRRVLDENVTTARPRAQANSTLGAVLGKCLLLHILRKQPQWSEVLNYFKEQYPCYETFKLKLPDARGNAVKGLGRKQQIIDFYTGLSSLGITENVNLSSYSIRGTVQSIQAKTRPML